MKLVNKNVVKKDAMSLLTGKPVYCDDLCNEPYLTIKLLRSPHAFAKIVDIDITKALEVGGIEAIYTYKDVPNVRFTLAGQSYPEPSPYDGLILDQYVRYVGDEVAIIAGENEYCIEEAMKLIKVNYEILSPILDPRESIDNKTIIHPEDNLTLNVDWGSAIKRNILSSGESAAGDLESAWRECDIIIEREYHTKANAQMPMETFRSYARIDEFQRLEITSSTQIPFHVRRIVSNALQIPQAKIRIKKPRIGGGFGAKQTAGCEVYTAFVTLKTGKASKIVYSREEMFTASNSRHEMYIKVKLGAKSDGTIVAAEMHTLSNTGAYGEHGPTTVGLSGHKTLPLYGKLKASKFTFQVVYTNTMRAGAYRGYGATQGTFAMESAVNELAQKLKIDPIKIREKNMVREGDIMPQYYGQTLQSCGLAECLDKARKLIDWDKKYPYVDMGNNKVRGVGVAMSMQGSAIAHIDVGSVIISLQDNGFYTLNLGCTDMGTGCDTILAQMAAEILLCSTDEIVCIGADTDTSPYDSGSYASATTYLTGMAVVKACNELVDKMKYEVARFLETAPENIDFDGKTLSDGDKKMTIDALAVKMFAGGAVNHQLTVGGTHSSPVSPPPFMVGIAEVEIDKSTGVIELINYVGVVDCGTQINPILTKVQTEGGIAQGIGMALYEDVSYTDKGRMKNSSLMNYRIPTRLDIGKITVDFAETYEPTGPFGAKSIGEVVINTPAPAIANAVSNALGIHIRELPITCEKIFFGISN